MTQYVNEYSTLFAVREHNGAPALMCKSKAMNKWSLSAALAAVKGDACTTEDLQEVLDEYARAHGWAPVNGFPSWAEDIVTNFVSRQWVQNLPDGFSAKGFKGSYEVKCREGSSCGDGFVDTGPQGITIWKGNSHRVKYTWVDFVRRCKQTGLAPELKPNSERKEKDLMRDIYFFESEDLNDSHLYSYYDGRFWAFDNEERAWCESSVIREAFETARNKSPLLKICEFIEDGFISYDETDVPDWAVKDLKEIAKHPITAAPASPADTGAAEQSLSAAGPASLAAEDTNIPTFDFSALGALADQAAEADEQFNLHYGRAQDEFLVACIYMARIHALTAKAGRYGGGTWTSWYQSKGISEGSARTMVQNGDGFKSATAAELKNLPALTKKDINLIARQGAAEQVLEAAGQGDSARVQEIMTQLKAAQSDKAAAERKATQCEEMKDSALETARQAQEDAANAESRARAAERERDEARKERDGAREALQASKMRGDRLKAENYDLKARPIEVPAVDEDEIDRRVEARLQQERDDSLAEQREIAARNAQDAILLLGRQINTSWQMVRPFLAEMEESRRVEAIDRINNEWAQTQKEILQCL